MKYRLNLSHALAGAVLLLVAGYAVAAALGLAPMAGPEDLMLGALGITTAQARVIDPILSQHSRGYSNPDVERVGSVLFPAAPVGQRGAKIVRFGKESFRLYNTIRAPGGAKKRVRVGYTSDSISLVQHTLSGEVPFEHMEDANRVPGIDLGRKAVNVPMESIAREKEYRQAVIAQNAANYATGNKDALSGTDQWDDYTNSNPGAQMDDYHAAIRARIGRRGNVLVLGPTVFDKAKRHPKIVGHFYTGNQAGAQSVTRAQLAEYFGVRSVAVGDDIYLPETAADTDNFVDMWGNVAILAYVPSVSGDGDIEVPSFGYTYYLSGHPMVEAPRQDRDHDVWVYDVKDEYQPVLTGMDAGFLISNVLGG